MRSVMMRIAASDVRQAACGAAHEAFLAEYLPLLEERNDAVQAAYTYRQEDAAEFYDDACAAADSLRECPLESEEATEARIAEIWAEYDRKIAEADAARDRRIAEADERYDAAIRPLIEQRDAALASAEAAYRAAWDAATKAEAEEGWKRVLRRGDWIARRGLVGKVPVDHPVFRRLLHDPDHDVRITASAHVIALRSLSQSA